MRLRLMGRRLLRVTILRLIGRVRITDCGILMGILIVVEVCIMSLIVSRVPRVMMLAVTLMGIFWRVLMGRGNGLLELKSCVVGRNGFGGLMRLVIGRLSVSRWCISGKR